MTTARTALLIADIGGYTRYMGTHRMSLAHAEVNTARMLEGIVRAARGFELVEIEGDAAFLARRADPRSQNALLAEIQNVSVAMHRAFHREREYVVQNLCPCDGCREARDLTVKFVAHVGEVATQRIAGRSKPVGFDVILVHRLLKNPVSMPEYLLMSEELYRTDGVTLPDAVAVEPDLEGIGRVRAYAVDIAGLDASPPSASALSWRGRLGSTFSAVGRGLPYMLGTRQPRRDR